MEPLTLSALIDKLGPPQETRGTVTRRIRHWTNSGLIPTVEEHPELGQGHYRTYGIVGAVVAAVLLELSDYKLPVSALEKILPGIIERAEDWDWKIKHEEILEYVINDLAHTWCLITFDKQQGIFEAEFFEESERRSQGKVIYGIFTIHKDFLRGGSGILLNLEKIGETVMPG